MKVNVQLSEDCLSLLNPANFVINEHFEEKRGWELGGSSPREYQSEHSICGLLVF